MLRKMPTRQIEGEPRREWFTDDYIDLYVWYQPDGAIFGFQLCYDKERAECALTWLSTGVFRHQGVDLGGNYATDDSTPILTHASSFSREPARTEFAERSMQIDADIRELILSKIDAYPPCQ